MTDLMDYREKSPRDNAEETLQKAIVAHLRLRARPEVIWFHVPNGEHRSKRTGARLKAMGVQPGIADLIFLTPFGMYAVELKRPGGRLSPEQKRFGEQCGKAGVNHAVIADIDTAIATLEGWGLIR